MLLAAALYLVLGLYANFSNLVHALSRFSWGFLPLALLLASLNYLIRFWKWEYLLRVIDIRVPLSLSFTIFFAGLSMTLSPGKMGEVLKSFLLKDHQGIPISRSSPVVVAERITDVIGILILGGLGSLAYGAGRQVLVITTVIVVIFLGIVQTRPLCLKLLHLSEKLPLINRFIHHLEEFYNSAYSLLKARHLIPAVALSTFGWFLECLAAYVCLRGLGLDVSVLFITFVFVIASLAGALAMIPGGLGVAEGSMTGLLVTSGIDRGDAVAGTLLIRFSTFWFAILLGLIGIFLYEFIFSSKGAHSAPLSSGNDWPLPGKKKL